MKFISQLTKYQPLLIDKSSWISFQLGLFFLPSSVFIASLFFLKALYKGIFLKDRNFLTDPWNYPFLLASCLMILGCFGSYSGWLAWIGLSNWIPFFFIFWGFQPYLMTSELRRRSALCLLFGSVPVLITGLGQMFFGWGGPWQLFNGLIIWFIDPNGEPNGRLSGLFDYANIAGAWFALIWPISLAALLQRDISLRLRGIAFIFSSSIVTSLILTDSRNAWGGLIIAIPFVLGPLSWFWLLPLLCLALLPLAFAVFPWFGSDLQFWSRTFVPESLWSRLSDLRYVQERSLASTRLSQWQVAINLLKERPWLGWGAAAFSVLYPLITGQWHGHAHNLPLEIGVSHGIPVAALIVIPVISLLIIALQKGVLLPSNQENNFTKVSIFDRAWWTSAFILVLLHGADMPLFDSRLNIAGWIFLAGLRCFISAESFNKKRVPN